MSELYKILIVNITILSLFTLNSCEDVSEFKPSHYKYIPYEGYDLFYLTFIKGYDIAAVGSELTLNDDFSFEYTTCGAIITGKWRRSGRNIVLNYKTASYRIDSLNSTRPKLEVYDKPVIWHIKDDKLIFTIKQNNKYFYQQLKRLRPYE